MILAETTNVIFVFDSIQAIFAITTAPFIFFTSNTFAIPGLRSLYFVLASVMDKFRYLKPVLIFILFFLGVKMILSHHIHLTEWVSLAVLIASLRKRISMSILIAPKDA